MGTLASVEHARDESFQHEQLVYDIKSGRNSILAAAGCFSAALLKPAGITFVDKSTDLVDIPDDFSIICPFALYQGMTVCIEVDGVMASAEKPAVYDCWTQVGGRLKRLVVHPRLDGVNMHISVEAYACEGWGGKGENVREKKGTRRRLSLSTDGKLSFDGEAVEPAERLEISIRPRDRTLVRSTDFIALMREDR